MNMETGELTTELVFSGGPGSCDNSSSLFQLDMRILQVASRSAPTLALMRIEATLTAAVESAVATFSPAVSAKGMGIGIQAELVNTSTPVPNWTWEPCLTMTLRSGTGSLLGLTVSGTTTTKLPTDDKGSDVSSHASSSASVVKQYVYDMYASMVAGHNALNNGQIGVTKKMLWISLSVTGTINCPNLVSMIAC
jgi:hypothetical protein